MPISWKRIVDQQETYTVGDFQRAALRLVTEQVLYQANPRQRNDYDLVAAYEEPFAEALDLLGCKLDHNRTARYAAAVPTQPEAGRVSLSATLLALVLRKLYDQHMNRGTLNAGIAGIGIAELETAYKESTGRDLPVKPQSELIGLLDDMKRWGIARAVKGSTDGEVMWHVEILPGIQSLITDRSLAMLKAHAETMYDPAAAATTETYPEQDVLDAETLEESRT